MTRGSATMRSDFAVRSCGAAASEFGGAVKLNLVPYSDSSTAKTSVDHCSVPICSKIIQSSVGGWKKTFEETLTFCRRSPKHHSFRAGRPLHRDHDTALGHTEAARPPPRTAASRLRLGKTSACDGFELCACAWVRLPLFDRA
jgi:hypothetical protein